MAGSANDLSPATGAGIDRDRLVNALRAYLSHKGVEANWDAIEGAPDGQLVISLAMMCPFRASEKQALLEAPTLSDRAEVMMALLEMALMEDTDGAHRFKQ